MKQKVRKALAVSGMAIIIGTSGIAYTANNNIANANTAKIAHTRKIKFNNKIIKGTVKEISEDSLIIKNSNAEYTIKINTDTKIMNQEGEKIKSSEIKVNDNVRVKGKFDGTTLTAKKIKDLSK